MTINDAQLTVLGGSHTIPMTTKLPSFILVSRDSIHLALRDFEARLSKRTAAASFAAIALSSLPVVVTSTGFNDFLGLSGQAWKTIYLLVCLFSTVCAVWQFCACLINWKKMTAKYTLNEIFSMKEGDAVVSFSSGTKPITPSISVEFTKIK